MITITLPNRPDWATDAMLQSAMRGLEVMLDELRSGRRGSVGAYLVSLIEPSPDSPEDAIVTRVTGGGRCPSGLLPVRHHPKKRVVLRDWLLAGGPERQPWYFISDLARLDPEAPPREPVTPPRQGLGLLWEPM